MPAILECKNLSHIYSEKTPFEFAALDGVDLAVERNSFTGLIGHTGSGKSTLIKHFNGLLKPSSGQILLAGEDIWEKPKEIKKVRFRVGLVFQYPEYQLFEETVYKDVAYGPKNMGLSDDEIEKRIYAAAELVGIGDEILKKSPFELSGGQKRRAAIAGVMAMEPEVLILDEPTAGLDPRGSREILAQIKRYQLEKGKTVVIVSHNMDEMARVADRIVVMNKGKVAMEGAPAEVFARGDELEKMGLAAPFAARVAQRLAGMGLPVDRGLYTVDKLAEAVAALKGGGADA